MAAQLFRELIVWKKSLQFAKDLYQLTRKMPREELYELTSQMRRAAVSIQSNIAEGSKRGTTKDFLQFLRIANGSAAELETQLILAKELYTLETANAEATLLGIQKMLAVLIKRLSTLD